MELREKIIAEDPRGIEILPDYAVPIYEYFIPNNEMAIYIFDFGDGWRHLIAYEDISVG
jgi:hypothetical protein